MGQRTTLFCILYDFLMIFMFKTPSNYNDRVLATFTRCCGHGFIFNWCSKSVFKERSNEKQIEMPTTVFRFLHLRIKRKRMWNIQCLVWIVPWLEILGQSQSHWQPLFLNHFQIFICIKMYLFFDIYSTIIKYISKLINF